MPISTGLNTTSNTRRMNWCEILYFSNRKLYDTVEDKLPKLVDRMCGSAGVSSNYSLFLSEFLR